MKPRSAQGPWSKNSKSETGNGLWLGKGGGIEPCTLHPDPAAPQPPLNRPSAAPLAPAALLKAPRLGAKAQGAGRRAYPPYSGR